MVSRWYWWHSFQIFLEIFYIFCYTLPSCQNFAPGCHRQRPLCSPCSAPWGLCHRNLHDAENIPMTDPWRIHGAGIYANIKGVYWWDPWHTIYSITMDPSWHTYILYHFLLMVNQRWFKCNSFWPTTWVKSGDWPVLPTKHGLVNQQNCEFQWHWKVAFSRHININRHETFNRKLGFQSDMISIATKNDGPNQCGNKKVVTVSFSQIISGMGKNGIFSGTKNHISG